jgi:hypothetical protein
MGAHTKGPWTIAEGANSHVFDGRLCPANDENVTIAFVDLDTADAHLIASAPDLLEALTALYASYKALADSGDAGNWRLEDTDEGQQTLAAIRKATGEA